MRRGAINPNAEAQKGQIKVPVAIVTRMADRMRRLSVMQRDSYIDRARQRLEAGHSHRNDAAVTVAQRAVALLAAGDVEGYSIWRHILEAVAEFTRTRPVSWF